MLTVTQSASKDKTAESCSFKYFATYFLRLPDPGNNGSKIGGITHVVLECLAEPKRRKLAEKIIAQKDIFHGKNCQGIKKLVYKHAHKLDVADEESIEKIKTFVLNGLSYDFWGEKRGIPVLSYTEKDFDIEKIDEYKIRGFIDRLFIYENGHALIRDYKSSKAAYQGHEATSENIQATSYALAVREMIKDLFPHVKTVSVEFLFLKFDCNVESKWETGIYQGKVTKKLYHNGGGRITIDYDWDEVEGFEFYLSGMQKYLEKFDENSAVQNFAFDQPEPEDGSFGGKISCGFATYPGQLKKDGTKMFACSYKFGFNYYYIVDVDDKFAASCFIADKEKFEKKFPPHTYKWEERSYEGCPRHKRFQNCG